MFLEIFQKPPSGRWTAARPFICVVWFSGFLWGTAWRRNPVLLGDTSYPTQFSGFWWTAQRWWTTVKQHESNSFDLDVFCVLGGF